MAKPTPPTTPPTPPKIPLTQKLKAFLITHKKSLLLGISTIIIFITSLAFLLKTQGSLNISGDPAPTPQTAPSRLTSYANHPSIASASAQLSQIEAEIKALQTDNHPLLPPTLDISVTLDK